MFFEGPGFEKPVKIVSKNDSRIMLPKNGEKVRFLDQKWGIFEPKIGQKLRKKRI